MNFTTFKKYCEANDATATHKTNPNTGFFDQNRKSFEQVVDPLVDKFTQEVISSVLHGHNVQLQPAQIEYIVHKLQTSLEGLRYNASNDLGSVINNIWRQGNTAAAPTPRDKAGDTSLATAIFDNKR